VRLARAAGCASISYTYTEPTIFFEYAYDTAVLARAAGLRNVFVSNGYITAEPLRAISPYLDAANIDLKSSRDEFYKAICGARLQPVLDALRLYRELGIWLEVTTLVIPGENDSDEDLAGCAGFIAKELGPEVPWHVSAFHPTYKLTNRPRTPPEALAAGGGTRAGRGAAPRLRGEPAGRGRNDPVPVVRPPGDHPSRVRRDRQPSAGGPLSGVRHADRRRLVLTHDGDDPASAGALT